MPHIPEDELHAYLDQALSRSQCVEIESHLASCFRCQTLRDGIAALRDRTTALLTVLAPPITLPPGIETIRARARGVAHGRQRNIRAGIWAASLLAALGLGWTANRWLDSEEASGRDLASVPRPDTAAAQLPSVPDSPRTSSSSPLAQTVAQREPAPAPSLERRRTPPPPRPEPAIAAAETTPPPVALETVAVDPLPALKRLIFHDLVPSRAQAGHQLL